MLKIKMNKMYSTHENVRGEIIGETSELPELNKSFSVLGKSLSFDGGVRIITTTPIKNIDIVNSKEWIIKTQNSTYRVEFLGD